MYKLEYVSLVAGLCVAHLIYTDQWRLVLRQKRTTDCSNTVAAIQSISCILFVSKSQCWFCFEGFKDMMPLKTICKDEVCKGDCQDQSESV